MQNDALLHSPLPGEHCPWRGAARFNGMELGCSRGRPLFFGIGVAIGIDSPIRIRKRFPARHAHGFDPRLDLQSFPPRFAIIDTAGENDAKRARKVCAGLKEGEIVLFDKAYVDFEHLSNLSSRGVYFVTRAKENMACRCVKRLIEKPKGNIIRDDHDLFDEQPEVVGEHD